MDYTLTPLQTKFSFVRPEVAFLCHPRFAFGRPMYHDIPMIILLLATGYLFTVYLLLMLAQRSSKVPR